MSFSASRSRRLLPSEPTLGLITFQLRQNFFCLPLKRARRVAPYPKNGLDYGTGIAQIQNQNIPIVDLAALVYPPVALLSGTPEAWDVRTASCSPLQHLLLVDLPEAGTVGLLTEGTPALRRVPLSACSPIPPVYLTMHSMQGVNTVISIGKDAPPLFLLEVENLLPRLPV